MRWLRIALTVTSMSMTLIPLADVRADVRGTGTLDERLAEIAARVPGFGGMFADAGGRVTAFLQDTTRKTELELVLRESFGDAIIPPEGIEVLPGEYDFRELLESQRRSLTVMSLAGVLSSDIDEGSNRLRIGVEHLGTADAIETALAALGVPLEQVRIEIDEPVTLAATLRDRNRPVMGGYQVQSAAGYCTLGAGARLAGAEGLLTCSHCTKTQGGVESTAFYQPTTASDNRIGIETADPDYRYLPIVCPSGRVCRWSDAAFVRYDSGVGAARGRIARPSGFGTLTIDPSKPAFRVTSEGEIPMTGLRLDKVGRTTGWTFGNITARCKTVNVSNSNVTLLCQDQVSASSRIVDGGDSGSPVFLADTAKGTAMFSGILWGSNSSGTTFTFSPVSNIEDELGSLLTCDPVLGC